MAQPFLETGEHVLLVPGFDLNQPVGRQSGLCQRRCEKIAPREAPEHLAFRAGGNPGGEKRRRRAVDSPIAAARHLMQASERQSAARKPVIDGRNTERQASPCAFLPAFEACDALAQHGNGRIGSSIFHMESLFLKHPILFKPSECSLFVPISIESQPVTAHIA